MIAFLQTPLSLVMGCFPGVKDPALRMSLDVSRHQNACGRCQVTESRKAGVGSGLKNTGRSVITSNP